MDINYLYVKRRRDFGKQLLFSNAGPDMVDSIMPDKAEQKKYILRNPVNQCDQNSLPFSEHTINTIRVKSVASGVNHTEGGWPKEINHLDEEAVARYRRKIEREDDYVEAVLKLAPKMFKYLRQNNAINHYQQYYSEIPQMPELESYRFYTMNHFEDPIGNGRPVSSLTWGLDAADPKLIVSYCCKDYRKRLEFDEQAVYAFIWCIEKPKEPVFIFEPHVPAWQLEPSPRSGDEIVGGLSSGQVCLFDIRASRKPVAICPQHVAHREPVSSLLFINSRSHSEFFTGSSDGQCLWWDYRDFSTPYEQITMTLSVKPGIPPTISNASGVTSMYYDRALPTRYLAGTETGFVVNVNRKGKTLQEIMSSQWFAHNGPVKTLQRNPGMIKLFITCGDYTVKLWSEDTKNDFIITSCPFRYQIADAGWAPNRTSSYFSISYDGYMYYSDILRSYKEPLISIKVTENQPTRLKVHEEGRMIAVGDNKGLITLMAVSDSMQVSGANDKTLMTALFDRENRREHILEARLKEIRLKLRQDAEKGEVIEDDVPDENEVLKQAHYDYIEQVEAELRKYNVDLKQKAKKKVEV